MSAQIRCGMLKDMKAKGGVRFRGRVNLDGRFDEMVVLRDHPRAKTDSGEVKENAPAFEVFFERNAREVPTGSAWLKHKDANQGRSSDEFDFLSLTIDSIRWPRPVYLTVFPPSKGDADSWPVVWSRPRGARVQDEQFDEREQENYAE